MTDAEWLSLTAPSALLLFLNERLRDSRRLRLFGCACCRRVWHLLEMDAARRVVELAEAYADGEIVLADLQAADASSDFADFDDRMVGPTAAGPQFSKLTYNLIESARWLASPTFNISDAFGVSQRTAGDWDKDFFIRKWHMGGADVPPTRREMAEQAKIVRDIFGNPFRPITFNPEWRTTTVVEFAQQMYKSRDFASMLILGDALQDAGCNSEVVLSHCRGTDPHVRGCFVVDLILGKE